MAARVETSIRSMPRLPISKIAHRREIFFPREIYFFTPPKWFFRFWTCAVFFFVFRIILVTSAPYNSHTYLYNRAPRAFGEHIFNIIIFESISAHAFVIMYMNINDDGRGGVALSIQYSREKRARRFFIIIIIIIVCEFPLCDNHVHAAPAPAGWRADGTWGGGEKTSSAYACNFG